MILLSRLYEHTGAKQCVFPLFVSEHNSIISHYFLPFLRKKVYNTVTTVFLFGARLVIFPGSKAVTQLFFPSKLLTLTCSEHNMYAWLTNVYIWREKWIVHETLPHFDMFPTPDTPNIWPPTKTPYQSSVNNMSFSCLLITELFSVNLLRFCDWGYEVQRRCSGVMISWVFFFPSSFLSFTFCDWGFEKE